MLIRNLEIHLSHDCNLRCNGCSHYSQFGHSGNLSLEDAVASYTAWNQRLKPQVFSLLGGEPTLNPMLSEHFLLALQLWEESYIRIVTNGFLLEKHPDFLAALRKCDRYILHISAHEENEKLKSIAELLDDQRIRYTVIHSYKSWTQRYTWQDGKIYPYSDNNPIQSWSVCPAKYCMQLYQSKLWKCPSVAYLGMMQVKNLLGDGWNYSLNYKGLSPECSDEELVDFCKRKQELICNSCPSVLKSF